MSGTEQDRLQALARYAVLDTSAEAEFDDITQLASFICAAPIALVSLVDAGRQWFKARVGLAVSQTSREHAFCAHAIRTPEAPLVVPDARQDPRFAENPMVTGAPHIRFYAGSPLVTPDGYALGTLCVLDHEPRELGGARLRALQALARQVVAQLELRRVARELEQRRSELEALSVTDGLTGVGNRRAFDRQLASEMQRAARERAPLSLLLADVDFFKRYNDAHGHVAGDLALQAVARILARGARPYDTVSRYGGEEFALILPGANAGTAVEAAERLRRSVERAAWPRGAITVSIGAATFDHGSSTAEFVSLADRALYAAKASGRNCVRHADALDPR